MRGPTRITLATEVSSPLLSGFPLQCEVPLPRCHEEFAELRTPFVPTWSWWFQFLGHRPLPVLSATRQLCVAYTVWEYAEFVGGGSWLLFACAFSIL